MHNLVAFLVEIEMSLVTICLSIVCLIIRKKGPSTTYYEEITGALSCSRERSRFQILIYEAMMVNSLYHHVFSLFSIVCCLSVIHCF